MVHCRIVLGLLLAVQVAGAGQAGGGSPSRRLSPEEAIRRLKNNAIIQAALTQAQAFAGVQDCAFVFKTFKELPQFEKGSAFEYDVRISCRSKTPDEEASAFIDVQGQCLNYGEALQDIERLSFHLAG